MAGIDNEKASLVHDFKTVHEFFLPAQGGVRSFDGSGYKSREMERRTNFGSNRESTVRVMLSTVEDFVKDGV